MSNEGRSVTGAAAFILGLALVGYLAVGFAGVLCSVAFIGGFVLWLLTTFRTPIDPQTIIVPVSCDRHPLHRPRLRGVCYSC